MEKKFIEQISGFIEQNVIPSDLYQKYNVKRGLRNPDGSGVLVGLTEIGDVHGYIISENEVLPQEGVLRYRGIDIKDLVRGFQSENRFGFEEAAFLLIFGKLPSKKELKNFYELLAEYRTLPPNFVEDMILKAPSKDIMNKLARTVNVSYSYDDNPDDVSVQNVVAQVLRLFARMPLMAAYAYQAKRHYHDGMSLFLHNTVNEYSAAQNFLHLIRYNKEFTQLEAELLDLALVLHAEHGGGNNSTFTVHVVSSSGTDTYSAIGAGIGSLKGPKHGGANARVMAMMDHIKKNVTKWEDQAELKEYLRKIIRKEAYDQSGLIYGLGHAIYTLSDPRAVILKEKAELLAKDKGREEEFELYKNVEKLGIEVFAEEKGTSKTISANVDFYSGFVYSMMGIPPELYTPLFAISRMAGWGAHRIEELVSGGRIIRPAYKNISQSEPYVSTEDRK